MQTASGGQHMNSLTRVTTWTSFAVHPNGCIQRTGTCSNETFSSWHDSQRVGESWGVLGMGEEDSRPRGLRWNSTQQKSEENPEERRKWALMGFQRVLWESKKTKMGVNRENGERPWRQFSFRKISCLGLLLPGNKIPLLLLFRGSPPCH